MKPNRRSGKRRVGSSRVRRRRPGEGGGSGRSPRPPISEVTAPDIGPRDPDRLKDDQAVLRLIERRENSLLSLFELSKELGVGLDVYAIAQLSLLSLMGHFGTRIAALWMRVDEHAAGVVPVSQFGMTDEQARALGVVLETCATAQLERDGGPARLAAWISTPRVRDALAAGVALVAPVAAQGRLVGLIALGERLDGEAYAAFDLEYLATAAGMVGVALDNARLYQQMLEANRRLLETNQQLAELDRLKSEFLQGVNHELRTPLAVIVGYLDVLRQLGLDDHGQRAVTASMEQAHKLDGMVQNLLDFSEPLEKLRPTQIERCDLAPLLDAYVRGRRPGVSNALREITLEFATELPAARCDRRGLTRVLDELVDNAVKFTPPGSRIVVRAVRHAEGGVAVEVQDDGPGMPPDKAATLFEPFRQGDGSTTREAGGLGLGLALARRLCEGMNGRLEVASDVGQGSTFRVCLEAEPSAG